MDETSFRYGVAETPEMILEAIRSRPGLDPEFEESSLDRLIERFPTDRLRKAIHGRLDSLGDPDGSVVLRIAEAQFDLEMAEALALALSHQPDLRPDRAWEALALLEGSGQLDRYPLLVELWDELNDAISPEDATENLAAQLEDEPEGSWVALEGLGAIDIETRREIIGSLIEAPAGPGLVAFLRLLSYAHDDLTRSAALEALFDPKREDVDHRRAWAEVAADHFDLKVRDRARRRLAIGGWTDEKVESMVASAVESPSRPSPELVGSLVTSVDGSGQGSVVLASRDRGDWVVASYLCDVWRGIIAVKGQVGPDPSFLASFFDEIVSRKVDDLIEDNFALATSLLASSWLRSGPETNPVLRFWVERTLGPSFQPHPFVGSFDSEVVASEALTMLAEPSWVILDACPTWADRSSITFDLAEAIILRAGDAPPDPRGDAGAYRYLFEHRLIGQMEHYRRLLLWMASFWNAKGDDELARSSVALAWQLADPQNAVPGHPFIVALSTVSLASARTDLRRGIDPRKDRPESPEAGRDAS